MTPSTAASRCQTSLFKVKGSGGLLNPGDERAVLYKFYVWTDFGRIFFLFETTDAIEMDLAINLFTHSYFLFAIFSSRGY